jgi:hypothetical protein
MYQQCVREIERGVFARHPGYSHDGALIISVSNDLDDEITDAQFKTCVLTIENIQLMFTS